MLDYSSLISSEKFIDNSKFICYTLITKLRKGKIMKTIKNFLAETDIIMPEGTINGGWFAEHDLPMIVSCTCCGMTMALPSAMVDDEGKIFCDSCV